MKKGLYLVSLFVSIALCLFLAGCASGPAGTATKTFKAVDPYIEGAIFYFDVNNSGTYEAGIDILSTPSLSNGSFGFTELPTTDAVMLQYNAGEHLGATYEGFIARLYSTMDASSTIILSPLTSLLIPISGEARFTAEQIAYILSTEALITIEPSAVFEDPMTGITNINVNTVTEAQLARIRASICVYAFTRIMDGINSDFGQTISYEALIASTTAEQQLQIMGQMVRDNLSEDVMVTVNMIIATNEQNAQLIFPLVDLPLVKANEVVMTSFGITNIIIYHIIDNGAPYTYTPPLPLVAEWVGKLGLRYYCKQNLDNQWVAFGLDHNMIRDYDGVTPLSSTEVRNATGWIINHSDTVEAVY